ncbi:MAG: hypothetical protein RL096_867 [Actinomycetota bacterium]
MVSQQKDIFGQVLVALVTPMTAEGEAASAQNADYAPETGILILQGDVLLTQGTSAIAGQTLTISLKTGLGTMEGRVTTTFTPAQPKKN